MIFGYQSSWPMAIMLTDRSSRDRSVSSPALGHEQTGLRGYSVLHESACKIAIGIDPFSRRVIYLAQFTDGSGLPTSVPCPVPTHSARPQNCLRRSSAPRSVKLIPGKLLRTQILHLSAICNGDSLRFMAVWSEVGLAMQTGVRDVARQLGHGKFRRRRLWISGGKLWSFREIIKKNPTGVVVHKASTARFDSSNIKYRRSICG